MALPPVKLELDPEPHGIRIELVAEAADVAADAADAAMDFEITEEPVLVEGDLVLLPPEPAPPPPAPPPPPPPPDEDLVLAEVVDVSAGSALDLPMDPSLDGIQGFELDRD